MMRSNEFTQGIPVQDEKGEVLGSSVIVPYYAIPQVTLSRIGMAVPSMVFGPIVFQLFSKMRHYKQWMATPIQILIAGFFLTFSTPLCCAIFPQKSSIPVKKLEPGLRKRIEGREDAPSVVYFNKGL
ncbi:unnamed protein product [Angiostrongylus costaricensis]|uniref:Sideroflexin-2 n=1 Tax=Angiostrongylus costaricensis TaxID=334426 RepID=A0A0R3PR87_ANGCS|nr:unnamed protein product [Angiostrongylus costaricensis]